MEIFIKKTPLFRGKYCHPGCPLLLNDGVEDYCELDPDTILYHNWDNEVCLYERCSICKKIKNNKTKRRTNK
jgi:hypothetical protein